MFNIGKLIKIARINKKLSQQDVADVLDVTTNYISLVENNRKDPSLDFLKNISKELDIPFVLLIWDKMNIPEGKSKEEREISTQLQKMLEEAQRIFTRNNVHNKE